MHVYIVYVLAILAMYLYKTLIMETGPHSYKAKTRKSEKENDND